MTRPAGTPGSSWPQVVARCVLGAALIFAGIAHLTFARSGFTAQVPTWLPLPPDLVVVASGMVELALGSGVVVCGRWRIQIGSLLALFFLAVFPGNIAQFTEGRDGFGLDTDLARGIRLLFQPLLVEWA